MAPRMRRLSHWLVLAVASIASLELASIGAGALLFGRGFYAASRAGNARPAGESSAPLAEAEALPLQGTLEGFTLHPYLGFVADPASPSGPLHDAEGRLEATELGFFRRTGSRVEGDPLRVAIFGGSVAFLFGLGSNQRLETALSRDLDLGARGVVVETFALPGHKQPQQLFTLAYLLLLGRAPDVVVNLDGFNEVALPLAENVPQGTAPFYPRSWGKIARGADDFGALQEAARLVALRDARDGAVRLLSGPVLDRSATAALLRQLADAWTAPTIDDLERRLLRRRVEGGGYGATGPPSAKPSRSALLDDLAGVWRRSSLLMQQLCDANGIVYVHVLQPNQYFPGAKTLTVEEERVAWDADHPYRSAVENGYPRLVEAGRDLRARGVEFTDLSLLFASVAEPVFVDPCCHVNRRGNDLLADRIAELVTDAIGRGR